MEKKITKNSILKRTLSIITALVLTMALLPQIPMQVKAATTRTADSWVALQTALTNAQDGDTIVLTASFSGTTTPLNFVADGRSITIASSEVGTQRVVTQSNKDIRHLNILGTSTAGITFTDDVVFDGSTAVTSATANGGGINVQVANATLNLYNAKIQNCRNSYNGGALAVTMNSNANLVDCEIIGNVVPNFGGGIYGSTNSKITITDSIISNNTSIDINGGGVFSGANGILTLAGNTTIDGNKSTNSGGTGGGIGVSNGTILTIAADSPGKQVKIINNTSLNNGAGIGANGTSATPTININGGLIDGNKIANAASGAGVWAGSGTVNMTAGTISNNIGSDVGGGIAVFDAGTLNMSGGTITQNVAHNGGGGIYAYTTSIINITGGTISSNVAQNLTNRTDMGGGGIWASANVDLNIANADIIGNIAEKGNGGGIRAGSSHITITNSNIINNVSSVGDGGGIYTFSAFVYSAKVTLLGATTIKGNTAPNGNGGGVFNNYFSNVLVPSSSVVFSDNVAKKAYMIKDADKVMHATNIKTTQFSLDTGYAYNNYDINYIGDKEYVPFTITLDAATDKKYKPNFPLTTAKIRTIGTVNVDDDVQYIMLPTTDTSTITTEAEFLAKAASVDSKYTGRMHKTEANLYNMYDITNPNLNGVLDNCKLWVMATGTNTVDNMPVVSFDTHTFTNIYTPINVFNKGETTSGSALYTDARVGIAGDLEAVYGLPLDLYGDLIINPDKGYDTIDDITHRDLEPFWTSDPSTQDDLTNVNLNSKEFIDKVYKFKYNKNPDGWFRAKFKFEDFNGVSLDHDGDGIVDEEETIDDFVPADDGRSNAYMLGMDLYQAPDITNYDPIGYKIGAGALVLMSFPLKYGEIVLPDDTQTVTIVYKQGQIKVREKFQLFQRDSSGDDIYSRDIGSDNITFVDNAAPFTAMPLQLPGYVYRGYSVNGVDYYLNSPDYPDDPYSVIPTIGSTTSDTVIIYKYKVDATNTGFADEDVKKIMVNGTGIDAHGNVGGVLYAKTVNALYGDSFTPEPNGTDDGTGVIIFPGDAPSQWILSKDAALYDVTPFTVTEDRGIKFYYYKDTSGNGTPDYLEANITLKYWNDENGQPLLNDLIITEHSPEGSFSRVAPAIPGYLAVGVIINKDGDQEGTTVYNDGTVKGEISPLGTNNWIMKFLYQPDTNNNGIPDNVEAVITVKTVYKLSNGSEETAQTDCIGRHGQTLDLSATSLNKDSNKFEYIGGLTEINATYTYNHTTPQTVTVIFEEKSNNTDDNGRRGGSGGGGGGSTPPSPTPPIPSPTPIPVEKPAEKQGSGGNNYSWATFEKPEEIFLDGALIPLSGLIFNGPYINGYPDKTIGPDRNLTRAEAAQIIYNLYGKPDQFINMENKLPYKDVTKDAWYAKAVAFLTQYDIVTGYPDGLFYPNKSITRAELVTLLVKYKDIADTTANENIFEDVANHWAKPQINAACKDNIISGFPDGTFKPNNLATRSEAITIINKMLKRPEKWIGVDEYTDLKEQDWAYKQLMNAANGYAED